jgi:hypothetical protein
MTLMENITFEPIKWEDDGTVKMEKHKMGGLSLV